jgi:hypothetical protein
MQLYCQWCEEEVNAVEKLWCWLCGKCSCVIKNKVEQGD